MNEHFSSYLRKHTLFIVVVGLFAFLALAVGEYALLRSQLYLNKMLSEGIMQIKEVNQIQATMPTVSPNPTTKKVLGVTAK
jgi:hypothetical protein